MRGMVGGDKADAAEQVSAALRQLEDALAECSGGKPYFGGEDVGFLDIVVGSYIGWFGAAEKIAGLRPRRGEHAATGGLGGAVLRARGRQGPDARRRQARRVRRGAPRGAGGQRFLPAIRRRGFHETSLATWLG
jgi:glutathione S-transferase